jgi:hypothetical protein
VLGEGAAGSNFIFDSNSKLALWRVFTLNAILWRKGEIEMPQAKRATIRPRLNLPYARYPDSEEADTDTKFELMEHVASYQDTGIDSSHFGADEWGQNAYPSSGPEESYD